MEGVVGLDNDPVFLFADFGLLNDLHVKHSKNKLVNEGSKSQPIEQQTLTLLLGLHRQTLVVHFPNEGHHLWLRRQKGRPWIQDQEEDKENKAKEDTEESKLGMGYILDGNMETEDIEH